MPPANNAGLRRHRVAHDISTRGHCHLFPKSALWVGNSLTGRRVIEYRAYFVGNDGHFVSFEGLSCADDAEAIAQAQRLVGNQDIELWSGERFIIRLQCKPDPPR
jgi:hypothetical protein